MNQEALIRCANELDILLKKYAINSVEVMSLYNALSDLIYMVRNKKVTKPLDMTEIPGKYGFIEGSLREYPGLEVAYYDFKIELEGGRTQQYERIVSYVSSIRNK